MTLVLCQGTLLHSLQCAPSLDSCTCIPTCHAAAAAAAPVAAAAAALPAVHPQPLTAAIALLHTLLPLVLQLCLQFFTGFDSGDCIYTPHAASTALYAALRIGEGWLYFAIMCMVVYGAQP